jgi:glycosyltransferase involved in cell wall biosynthesis
MYSRMSISYALTHSDCIVGVSQGVLDVLLGQGHPAWKRAQVIHHGVRIPALPDAGQRLEFRRSLGWPEDAKVIIHVGRFHPQKNHTTIVRVFHDVRKQNPLARLIFVGDGPQRPDIEAMVSSLGLRADVGFLGIRDNAQEIMTLCDLFLFPSTHEGFGIVAIEASAAALPVVATRIPGIIDAVKDGASGVLCTLDDEEGMTKAVVKFLGDEAYSREVGQAGRGWVEENFSLESVADKHLELYRQCLLSANETSFVEGR